VAWKGSCGWRTRGTNASWPTRWSATRSVTASIRSTRNASPAYWAEALVDTGLADDERLRTVLHDYFAWATNTTMARYHDSADDVPAGLRIPHWSWDGLVGSDATAPG
jgi:hypothetical protein